MLAEPIYNFRYYDPLRKRWIQARYRATPAEIAQRYARFELVGEPWTPTDVDGRAKEPDPAPNP